jgi:hypothetical protein
LKILSFFQVDCTIVEAAARFIWKVGPVRDRHADLLSEGEGITKIKIVSEIDLDFGTIVAIPFGVKFIQN